MLSCSAVYCNRPCLFVCLCVCGSVTIITRNVCIDPHQTGFVGKGSDHLQLIKFWPSCAPGRGLQWGEHFWLRLTTASAQCLHRLQALFLHASFLLLLLSIFYGPLQSRPGSPDVVWKRTCEDFVGIEVLYWGIFIAVYCAVLQVFSTSVLSGDIQRGSPRSSGQRPESAAGGLYT